MELRARTVALCHGHRDLRLSLRPDPLCLYANIYRHILLLDCIWEERRQSLYPQPYVGVARHQRLKIIQFRSEFRSLSFGCYS